MHTLKISIMVPDIHINHWGLHSWGHGTSFKNYFLLQNPCPSLILHSSSPPPPSRLKSQWVTPSSALMLHMGFFQAHHHQGQSCAGPSWELIRTEVIPETRKVCWCQKICKQQKARGKAAAAEVPPWGSHQHSGNFLELGLRCLCIVQLTAPAPSPPSQASQLFQVSTCPWFPCQPMQIPHHSLTFSSLRQGFTDSLSLQNRIGDICFPQTFLSAVP